MADKISAGGDIIIVDEDTSVRDILMTLFRERGFEVACFSEQEALQSVTSVRSPCCMLLDVKRPRHTGFDILRKFKAHNSSTPIFVMSAVGDIRMAVEAMRSGAIDFIEKPFNAGTLVDRVSSACQAWKDRHSNQIEVPAADFTGHELLTAREHEVLAEVTRGASNKEIGRVLGISPRTVEVHRARMMEKLGARNAADLVRIVLGQNKDA